MFAKVLKNHHPRNEWQRSRYWLSALSFVGHAAVVGQELVVFTFPFARREP